MNDINVPEITEDDVLAGRKTFPVPVRVGGEIDITVHALNWRTALQASTLFSEGNSCLGVVTVIQKQPKPLCEDAFLDNLVPAAMMVIATVALQLSNGVGEAKKRMAKPATPASGITSPSSVS